MKKDCHAREDGHPGFCNAVDSRLRRNDIRKMLI